MEKETPVWKGGPQTVAGVLVDVIHVELVLVVREGSKPEENLHAQICKPLKELRPLEPAAVFWCLPTQLPLQAAVHSTNCTEGPGPWAPSLVRNPTEIYALDIVCGPKCSSRSPGSYDCGLSLTHANESHGPVTPFSGLPRTFRTMSKLPDKVFWGVWPLTPSLAPL